MGYGGGEGGLEIGKGTKTRSTKTSIPLESCSGELCDEGTLFRTNEELTVSKDSELGMYGRVAS